MGFPIYVALDKTPENGSEIQNATCVRSGIMIRIRIVKSARNEGEQQDDRYNFPHGTKVLKELVMPWADMYRVVCEDSYFVSVPDAK